MKKEKQKQEKEEGKFKGVERQNSFNELKFFLWP